MRGRFLFLVLLLATLLLLGPGAASAETRGLTIKLKASEAMDMAAAGEVELCRPGCALVVGIDNSTEGRRDLKGAIVLPHRIGTRSLAQRQGSTALWQKPGKSFRDCHDCPEMVVVPAGSFRIGSPSDEEGREDSEGPMHEVTIPRSFALGKYEVTRAEFAFFVGETAYDAKGGCYFYTGNRWKWDSEKGWREPGFGQTDRHPVVCAAWPDAQAYVRWLSKRTGQRYRLPSESEWEYAARVGTVTPRYWGQNRPCDYANVADLTAKERYSGWTVANCWDGHVTTAPVGSFRPNAFGLHDLLGNVTEWMEDCWHDDYRGAPSDSKAWTMRDGCGTRVLRGGSWVYAPAFVRSAKRNRSIAVSRVTDGGFRVARSID